MQPVTVSVSDASGGVKYANVCFDSFASPNVGFQCIVTGTVNYTVQFSYDDPNSPSNPVPYASMNWFDSTDTAVVGATASKASSFANAPVWARIKLNSGTGTVTGTFVQYSNAPY